MFKLIPQPIEVLWPVTVTVPDAAGKAIEHKIELRYQVPTDMREGAPDAAKPLKDLIVGWEGVADESGNPLPYSEENKAALLGNPFVLRAADLGLRQIYAGEFQRKN